MIHAFALAIALVGGITLAGIVADSCERALMEPEIHAEPVVDITMTGPTCRVEAAIIDCEAP